MYYDFADKIYGRYHTVFMVALALVAAIVAMYILRGVLNAKREKRDPRLTKAVKIIAKRTEDEVTDDGEMYPTRHYFVTYLIDGARLEFPVSHDVYEDSKEGNTGYLMYQGKKFLAFKTTY